MRLPGYATPELATSRGFPVPADGARGVGAASARRRPSGRCSDDHGVSGSDANLCAVGHHRRLRTAICGSPNTPPGRSAGSRRTAPSRSSRFSQGGRSDRSVSQPVPTGTSGSRCRPFGPSRKFRDWSDHDERRRLSEYAAARWKRTAGIAAGPDGTLWFVLAGTNAIGRITTSGVVTSSRSRRPSSGPRQSPPEPTETCGSRSSTRTRSAASRTPASSRSFRFRRPAANRRKSPPVRTEAVWFNGARRQPDRPHHARRRRHGVSDSDSDCLPRRERNRRGTSTETCGSRRTAATRSAA